MRARCWTEDEVGMMDKPLMCRDPLCPISGPHELHDEPEDEMAAAFLAGANFAWERRGDAQGHWDFEKGAQKYVENVLRIAKEDAEAERIDNSQFGVGA